MKKRRQRIPKQGGQKDLKQESSEIEEQITQGRNITVTKRMAYVHTPLVKRMFGTRNGRGEIK